MHIAVLLLLELSGSLPLSAAGYPGTAGSSWITSTAPLSASLTQHLQLIHPHTPRHLAAAGRHPLAGTADRLVCTGSHPKKPRLHTLTLHTQQEALM